MRNEIALRLIFFFGIFVIVAFWELRAPRRGLTASKKVRWISNLGITFMNPILVRLLFPVLAVNMAIKSGNALDIKVMKNLVDQLFACQVPDISPGGEKTFTMISTLDIQQLFKQ